MPHIICSCNNLKCRQPDTDIVNSGDSWRPSADCIRHWSSFVHAFRHIHTLGTGQWLINNLIIDDAVFGDWKRVWRICTLAALIHWRTTHWHPLIILSTIYYANVWLPESGDIKLSDRVVVGDVMFLIIHAAPTVWQLCSCRVLSHPREAKLAVDLFMSTSI